MFVHWSGIQFWGIVSFALHQIWSSDEELDGLHHQHQAILRNGVTDTNTFIKAIRLAFAWRRKVYRPVTRSIPLIVLALLHIIGFGIAGIFSSRVARSSDEVLIKPANCGWYRNSGWSKPLNEFNQTDWDQANIFVLVGQVREATKVDYSRTCYEQEYSRTSSICNFPVKSNIVSTATDAESCPFASEMCATGPALQLDSGYMSSDLDLGLNAEPQNRIWFRLVTTWTPVPATNFTSNWTSLPGDPLTGDEFKLYYFGSSLQNGNVTANYTFGYSNYSWYDYPGTYRLL